MQLLLFWQIWVLTPFPKVLRKACSVLMSLYKERQSFEARILHTSVKLGSDLFERKILGKLSKIPFDQYLRMQDGYSWAVYSCPFLLQGAVHNPLSKHKAVSSASEAAFLQFTPSVRGPFQNALTDRHFSIRLNLFLGQCDLLA